MEKNNEELIGEVEIKLYKGHTYSISHNFKNSSAEAYFVLCMIDRVLVDVSDTNHKHSLATIPAKYMTNSRNERVELDQFFKKYNENIDPENKVVFGAKYKLSKQKTDKGTKLRVDTDYSPDKILNCDGKIGVSIMLYVIDLMNRISVGDQQFIAKAYTAMLQEYFDTDFPTNKTVGIAPVKAISSVIKSMR